MIIGYKELAEFKEFCIDELSYDELFYKKKQKGLYYTVGALSVLAILQTILILLFAFLAVGRADFLETFSSYQRIVNVLSSLFLITVFSFAILMYQMRKNVKADILNADEIRAECIRHYYSKKNMTSQQIRIVNDYLEKSLQSNNKHKTSVIIIWATLCLPIWQKIVDTLEMSGIKAFFWRIPLVIIFTSLVVGLFMILSEKSLYYLNYDRRRLENAYYISCQIYEEVVKNEKHEKEIKQYTRRSKGCGGFRRNDCPIWEEGRIKTSGSKEKGCGGFSRNDYSDDCVCTVCFDFREYSECT